MRALFRKTEPNNAAFVISRIGSIFRTLERPVTDKDYTVKRSQLAIDYIATCCNAIGRFHGNSDVHQYLKETASEMATAEPSNVMPDRYIEHVACAVDMVASNRFTSPPAAIAAVYLATRFEFYFRVLSAKLNGDGTWVSTVAQQSAQLAIKDDRISRKRISSVALSYKIMKLDQSQPVVQHFTSLDNALNLEPTTDVGPNTVTDLRDRIEFGRHAVAHGHWGDISAEALFYGLMTSLVFYNAG